MRGVGNAAYLVLVWFSESDDEVREVLAELWAGRCWARRGDERARARRSNGEGGGPLRLRRESEGERENEM